MNPLNKGFVGVGLENVRCNKLELDGYSDWRLPTVEELLGITDDNRIYPSIKSGIKNIGTETGNVTNAYWTSTTWKNFTPNEIFCVDFGGGLEYVCKKSYTVFLTRCVRDNK